MSFNYKIMNFNLMNHIIHNILCASDGIMVFRVNLSRSYSTGIFDTWFKMSFHICRLMKYGPGI